MIRTGPRRVDGTVLFSPRGTMSDQPPADPTTKLEGQGEPGVRRGVDAVGALAEPTRRALYGFVAAQHDWVSRDQAAAEFGLRRGITAHHLDRLVDDGLLEVDQRRLNGKSGPGAGRPAKVYRRSADEIGVSLPPRRYDLAGRLLSKAVDTSRRSGQPIEAALQDAAKAEGRKIAAASRARLETDGELSTTKAACQAALFEELRARGYEPVTSDDDVTLLRNCPFHQLSQDHTELICTMNLDLLQATVEWFNDVGLQAHLEPRQGECCVQFRASSGEPQPLG